MIVPSRGRPQNVERLYRAWDTTGAGAELWVCVDNDDPELDGYRSLDHRGVLHIETPAGSIVPIVNRHALAAAHSGFRHIGFMGDDHHPTTHGWDARLSAVLDELGTGVAYGNDLFQRGNLPTAVSLTANIVTTLGYMIPPVLRHLYADDTWKAWGAGIGRLTYLDDVIIEHLHPQAAKSEWDDGYVRVNGGEMWEQDTAAWHLYQAGGLHHDLLKLKGLLDG